MGQEPRYGNFGMPDEGDKRAGRGISGKKMVTEETVSKTFAILRTVLVYGGDVS